jgi:hypothetical protein
MRYLVAALVEYTVETDAEPSGEEEDALATAMDEMEGKLKEIGVSVGSIEPC